MFALGIAAALTSPLILNIGFIIWQDHWKGSAFSLNLFKCNLASLGFLVLSCTATTSEGLFPSSIFTRQSVGYLMLSSLIGIVIGDWAWLRGLQLLGARRTILMDSIKPFLAYLFGYVILNETLRPAALGGIVLTVVGVLLVSLETTKDEEEQQDDDEAASDEVNLNASPVVVEEEEAAINGRYVESVDCEFEQAANGDQIDRETEDSSPPLTDESDCAEQLVSIARSTRELDTNDNSQAATTPQRKVRSVKQLRVGYFLSLLNAGLDTYGAVLTKQYGADMTVWEISLLRFGFAGLVMLVVSVAFYVKAWAFDRSTAAMSHDITENADRPATVEDASSNTPWYALPFHSMKRRNWICVIVGVLLVTFAAPSLFNYALFQIALALTLTLTSVGPLYSLPLEYLMQNERPTWRATIGAVLAVAGIVVLAFKGPISRR